VDPKFFAIDYQQTLEVLSAMLLLALVVERSLAVVFESKYYAPLHDTGLKPFIVLGLSLFLVHMFNMDMLAIVFSQEKTSWTGFVMTAAVIAGGTKGIIKLMTDVLKIPGYKDTPEYKKVMATKDKKK